MKTIVINCLYVSVSANSLNRPVVAVQPPGAGHLDELLFCRIGEPDGSTAQLTQPDQVFIVHCCGPRSSKLEEERIVPKLTVEGVGDFNVAEGKRLVLALTEDAKVDQLHACGGNARCTTCRVEFVSGEPNEMTVAEKTVLAAKGVTGVRLSCQIQCQADMTVRCISRLEGTGRPNAGQTPTAEIAPPAEWTTKS